MGGGGEGVCVMGSEKKRSVRNHFGKKANLKQREVVGKLPEEREFLGAWNTRKKIWVLDFCKSKATLSLSLSHSLLKYLNWENKIRVNELRDGFTWIAPLEPPKLLNGSWGLVGG